MFSQIDFADTLSAFVIAGVASLMGWAIGFYRGWRAAERHQDVYRNTREE